MSQDLVLCPLEGAPDTYESKVILDILSRGASHPVTDFECLYPDGSRGESHGIPDVPQERMDLPGFTHFGGRTMMERIYELADALDVFVCWSNDDEDGPNACVTRAERIDRIPEEAREVLTVVVARDAEHLNQLVKGVDFHADALTARPTPP